jgi:ribulose-bisphosphate carboxylase large chain
MNQPPRAGEALRVTYVLAGRNEAAAAQIGEQIAREQTVELPADCVPDGLSDTWVGQLVAVELTDVGCTVVIDYNVETIGAEIPQLFNLLFGNISLQQGVRITSIGWPSSLLSAFRGPRHGISGLRSICEASARPLLCAALKPMGLPTTELARLCFEFAAGGVDIVKDDHGLTDQTTAPFDARVTACAAAVERANAAGGGHAVYFPNLTGPLAALEPRLRLVKRLGCRGALVSPLIVGPDTVNWIAEESGLALLAHPALSGSYFAAQHGIDPQILLGQLFRLIGSDGVIYPNTGGRFPFSLAQCEAINTALRGELGEIAPSFPVPGGGIEVDHVPQWIERYGPDTVFLIGGSLYRRPDLTRATAELATAMRG